jgi:hypothetical protein
MNKKNNSMWRLIAKSLGEKSGKDDKESDKIAIIRLFIFLSIFITNGFIIFNAIRTHIVPRDYVQKVECIGK